MLAKNGTCFQLGHTYAERVIAYGQLQPLGVNGKPNRLIIDVGGIQQIIHVLFLAVCGGLADYKVAKQTGVSPTVLSQWKRGEYNLKLEKLQKLAKLFGIPVQVFYDPKIYYKFDEEVKT